MEFLEDLLDLRENIKNCHDKKKQNKLNNKPKMNKLK